MRKLAAVLAAAACVAGCGTSTTPDTQPGPLGPPYAVSSDGLCAHAGQVVADGNLALTNSSAHPVRITGARVTGAKQVTAGAVYADVEPDGLAMTSAVAWGEPPAKYRHRLPVTVPAGANVEVIIMLTVHGSGASAAGEDVSYAAGGRSWLQENPVHLVLKSC